MVTSLSLLFPDLTTVLQGSIVAESLCSEADCLGLNICALFCFMTLGSSFVSLSFSVLICKMGMIVALIQGILSIR